MRVCVWVWMCDGVCMCESEPIMWAYCFYWWSHHLEELSLFQYLQVQKQTICSATDVTGTKECSASGQFKQYRQV